MEPQALEVAQSSDAVGDAPQAVPGQAQLAEGGEATDAVGKLQGAGWVQAAFRDMQSLC